MGFSLHEMTAETSQRIRASSFPAPVAGAEQNLDESREWPIHIDDQILIAIDWTSTSVRSKSDVKQRLV
jgi:hypothetical protein